MSATIKELDEEGQDGERCDPVSSHTPEESSTAVTTSVKKRQRIACDNCRQRKSKCDGALPCSYCKDKSMSCRYAEPTRRGPVSKKECNNGISFSVFTEYKMMQTMETKQYIQLYMEHVNPLFPFCTEAKLMNPQSTPQKVQTYAALAFVSQVYCDAAQSKVFIQNAKQLAASFFDEPSFDAAVAMTMMGQYWYNLTPDQVNASTYSSLGYSLAKYLPMTPINQFVRNFAYFHHIVLDPSLAPSQSSSTMHNHIPSMKSANWAASEIFSDFMVTVSKIISHLRCNLSITSTFLNLSMGVLSEAARTDLLASINQLDYKLHRSPKLPVATSTFYTITNRMTRCYVEWKSGHLGAAGEIGVQVLHLFLSLRAAKKLYVMLVDRPYINVEFLGLNVCAMKEAGRFEEAEQLLTFMQDYFPAIVSTSKIISQIDNYLQSSHEQRESFGSYPQSTGYPGEGVFEVNVPPSHYPPPSSHLSHSSSHSPHPSHPPHTSLSHSHPSLPIPQHHSFHAPPSASHSAPFHPPPPSYHYEDRPW